MELIYWPDKRLTQECEDAEMDESLTELTGKLEYFVGKYGGVGLAAPQVGVMKNVAVCRFVIKGKDGQPEYGPPEVVINPEIIEESDVCVDSVEACLSLPGARARVKSRKSWVTILLFDTDFRPVHRTFRGADAVIIQHEMDHLKGKTLFDRVGKIKRQLMEKAISKMVNKR